MTNIDDEIRVLQSALRNLEGKHRRSMVENYLVQIKKLKEMIKDREHSRREVSVNDGPCSQRF